MKVITRIAYQLFIHTSKTPNPNFLKFMPVNRVVMGTAEPVDIPTREHAYKISPLAHTLFRVDGVTHVFFGKDFISISKKEQANWNQLKPLIFQLIQNHYQLNQPLIVDRTNQNEAGIQEGDSPIVKQIKQLLVSRIRPFVQDDGGDVQFVSFDQQSGILTLKMLGSCAGCPSTTQTLRNGILRMMKYYIGEIKDVVSSNNQTSE